MKQYKVVKVPHYFSFYEVYRKVLWRWVKIGSFDAHEQTEEWISAKAKEIASPETMYWNA